MAEDDLGKRIAAAQKAHDDRLGKGRISQASGRGMGIGFRMASEFVASVFVGAALGWGLDEVLGTRPWMLIVWLLLGFVAGIMNVVRVAQSQAETQDGGGPDGPPVEDGKADS